ncbi:signal peptidase I [Candidatus Saccharibacteria bacterium]|nr:signal peptidase I [Candidatus Saccharibacteria bacterium]
MGIVRKSLRTWRNFIRYLNRKVRYLGWLIHFVATVAVAFVCFALSSVFLIDVTTVDGESMEPTLSPDDRLLTLQLGRFFSELLGAEYVPKRGEIIVFGKDGDNENLIIKRVVGLPEERVVIKNQTITIYNDEYPEGFEPDFNFGGELAALSGAALDVYVKRGELFVLGDNLAVSADSRTNGNVLVEHVNGNLIIRTWPFSKFKLF